MSENEGALVEPGHGDRRYLAVRRAMFIGFMLLVLTQRFALHAGRLEISLAFFVGLLVVAQAVRRGYGRVCASRVFVWILLVLLVAASTAGALLDHAPRSVPSAAAFLVCMFFLTVRSTGDDTQVRGCRDGVLAGFFWLGLITGVIVLLQWFVQRASGSYFDLIDHVPQQFLLTGYNSHALLSFGSGVRRPNGMLFLEPSIASQFLALAVIATYLNAGLTRRRRRGGMLLMLFALVVTASGTGLVVAAAGLLLAARPARLLSSAGVVAAGLLLLAALFGTSAIGGRVVSQRVTEVTRSGGSEEARFVLPYQTVRHEGFRHLNQIVVGNGPGTADLRAARELATTERNENFGTVLKLYWEYGALAALLTLGWLFRMSREHTTHFRPLSIAFLMQYLILTGSLVFPFEPVLLSMLGFGFAAGSSGALGLATADAIVPDRQPRPGRGFRSQPAAG